MSNDFINRRFYDNRRRPSTRTVQGEVIQIADFDTFIWHVPGNAGADRWNFIPNATGNSTSPNSAKEIPIGLMNPWNHANGVNFPPDTLPIAPRTPTRAIFGFNLQGLTTGASIVDAKLSLTVAGESGWNEFVQIGGVVPNSGGGAAPGPEV